MRNMSFSLTTKAFLDGTKDVTRRLGWKFLQPGDRFCAVEKCMGLRKGEHVRRLGVCEVVSVTRERLCSIELYEQQELRREGFPDLTWREFIDFFCKHMRCTPDTIITRIEFKRVCDRQTMCWLHDKQVGV